MTEYNGYAKPYMADRSLPRRQFLVGERHDMQLNT